MTTSTRRAFAWPLRVLALLLLVLALYVLASLAYGFIHERGALVASAPAGGTYTSVDGVMVHSQVTGRAGGTPLLLVHGTAAWSGTWFSLIPALNRAGYRVIAVDLPPFGYSDKSVDVDFSRAAQARRLEGVLNHHGVDRAIVVGHSFGGGPALELALAAPTRVSQLVLVDAALGLDSRPAPDSVSCRAFAVAPLRHTVLAATATNPLWSRTLLASFVARKEAITSARLAQYRRPSSVEGATGALGAWAYHFACMPEQGLSTEPAGISRLQVPLTLVWGAEDSVTPMSQAQRLQALVPRSQLRAIDRVGHIPHIEDPVAFESLLVRELHESANAPTVAASVHCRSVRPAKRGPGANDDIRGCETSPSSTCNRPSTN